MQVPADSLAGRVLAAQEARRTLLTAQGLRSAADAVVAAVGQHRCGRLVAASGSAAMVAGVAVAVADRPLEAVDASRVQPGDRVLVVEDTAVSGAKVAAVVDQVREVAPSAFVAVLILADYTCRGGLDDGWRDLVDVVVLVGSEATASAA